MHQDAAAGPCRAHRLRLLRAGDDPLRARELQGFRFRAAARPGAACSYAMQDQARGGPEPSPVRRRRQRAARLTAPRNRRSRLEIILGVPFAKEWISSTNRACVSVGHRPGTGGHDDALHHPRRQGCGLRVGSSQAVLVVIKSERIGDADRQDEALRRSDRRLELRVESARLCSATDACGPGCDMPCRIAIRAEGDARQARRRDRVPPA